MLFSQCILLLSCFLPFLPLCFLDSLGWLSSLPCVCICHIARAKKRICHLDRPSVILLLALTQRQWQGHTRTRKTERAMQSHLK